VHIWEAFEQIVGRGFGFVELAGVNEVNGGV